MMKHNARKLLFSTATLITSLLTKQCLTIPAPSPTKSRSMQAQPSTDFLTKNPTTVLQFIESHLYSFPVQNSIQKLFSARIQYQDKVHTYPSVLYTFDGFWNAWKKNLRLKLLLAGDDTQRNETIVAYREGRRMPDEHIIIEGYEYGLANIAAFLAQIMVDGIFDDECSLLSGATENECESWTEDERWTVLMKKWEEVEDYSFGGWDYKSNLVEFVDGGMNRLEYDPEGEVDVSFIHEVSGVFGVGCHDVDSEGKRGVCPGTSKGVVKKMSMRRTAFSMALSALHIPTCREVELVETTLEYLKGRKDGFVDNLLLYKSGENMYPSQRYQFDDMLSAIATFSNPPNITHPYPDKSKSYFHSPHHLPFYMGDPYMKHGHKYGLGNIALFFANGLQLSIEKDDACDETNEYDSNGKIPISNSCGQRGLSYQDMVCPDDGSNMACPIDEDMELTAVTFNRLVGSAPPLMCAPTSKIEFTGYWNTELVREEKSQPYANDNGRTDVSGCCWWGRGVLQTRGPCAFGRLNHYLGAAAKSSGRRSLFPDIDFCANPEAVCASQEKRQLMWMSGLFLWIDKVQTYDRGGFNYMRGLHEFADSGFRDEDFIIKTHNIVTVGCHDPPCQNFGCIGSSTCAGATPDEVDMGHYVTKAYRTFMEVDLWSFPTSPGGSNVPSPSPSQCKVGCTDRPTYKPLSPTISPSASPVVDPTLNPTESPSSLFEQRMEYFVYVKMLLEYRKNQIVNEVFSTPGDAVYTFNGFLQALEFMFTTEPEGLAFYLGQDSKSNLGHGIANIALFLAHAATRGLRLNACDEKVNQDINENCPMPIAAMECPVLVDSVTRRGILLNQSPCDIGRFNYIFGKPAHTEKRESAQYNFDFCVRPQVICYDSSVDPSGSVQNTSNIKYLLGLTEWIDRIQTYSWGYWDYIERLKMFVDSGMNDFAFVDEFSKIVVKSPDDANLRKATFKALLLILFSEIKPNPPISNLDNEVEIPPYEVTIPPYEFETPKPSSSTTYALDENDLVQIETKPPTESIIISPAPILLPQPEQESTEPGVIESSLPASTRVDLTNCSVGNSTITILIIVLSLVASIKLY